MYAYTLLWTLALHAVNMALRRNHDMQVCLAALPNPNQVAFSHLRQHLGLLVRAPLVPHRPRLGKVPPRLLVARYSVAALHPSSH